MMTLKVVTVVRQIVQEALQADRETETARLTEIVRVAAEREAGLVERVRVAAEREAVLV